METKIILTQVSMPKQDYTPKKKPCLEDKVSYAVKCIECENENKDKAWEFLDKVYEHLILNKPDSPLREVIENLKRSEIFGNA